MAQETINFSLTVNPVAGGTFKIVDANGNTLNDGDSVPLTAETVGVQDTQELFTVSGGTPPYNFSVVGGAVPDGDSLNSVVNSDASETVTLEGTPTTAGDATFDVQVSDSSTGATPKKLTAKKKIA